MSLYMIQSTFTADAWAIMAKTPQNRGEAVRPAIEQIGGKLISYYFSFGEYDSVVIAELPDNATACAAAIGAGFLLPERRLRLQIVHQKFSTLERGVTMF